MTCIDIWRVRTWAIPIAFMYMALHRRIRRRARFAKLMGTGAGLTFTPRDADLHQWAILTVWPSQHDVDAWRESREVRAWNRISAEHAAITLRAISSHGTWSKEQPFEVVAPTQSGPVAAITRARIKNRLSRTFWRSVPPVTTELHHSPGLIAAIGIGEAPIGLQGTFSLWQDSAALRAFAYQGQAHQEVIARTSAVGWYAEELFARFEVVSMRGQLQGQDLSQAG